MSEGTGFHRAYRYRLRSNRKAEAVLRRWAGCSRKVWNLALAEQQARRERGEKYAGYVTMAKWVTAWRKATETTYLAEVPVHVLQNVVRALDGAFQRFFRKEGGYPRFKRRGDPIGLRETDVKCFAVDAANGRLRFPKVGWLRYRASRPIEGRPITVTLRAEAKGAGTCRSPVRSSLRRSCSSIPLTPRSAVTPAATPMRTIARAKSFGAGPVATPTTRTSMPRRTFWPRDTRFWPATAKRSLRDRCSQTAR